MEPIDIFSGLRNEHSGILDLMTSIEEAGLERHASCWELLTELKRRLERHVLLEEELLFPLLMERDDCREFAVEGTAEHRVMRCLIDETMSSFAKNSPWLSCFQVMREDFEHHFEEENDVFAKMMNVLDPEDLRAFAKKLNRVEKPSLAA